jgi:uncharacterized protein (TIGR02646 family)
MRAINRLKLKEELPQSWLDMAKEKTAELLELYAGVLKSSASTPPEETWKDKLGQTFDSKTVQSVWQDKQLKAVLMKVSFGKCWYCEARVAERADNAVDHFRPKGRVAEDKTHSGYWWLAFSWENYRFACTFCNSARISDDGTGGKQDHFRLWQETTRARTPKDLLEEEQPLLLDPLQPDDTAYLTFDKDGAAVPVFPKEEDDQLYECAVESIKRYHLNRKWIKEHRRTLIASLDEQLDTAEKSYMLWKKKKTPEAQLAYRTALKGLLASIDEASEFSAAARAFLASKRGTSKAAEALFRV